MDVSARRIPGSRTLLGAAFVVSGAVALVAEQAFERQLSTVVGASTPAAAIVLAVYFVGLTLGGALYGPLRKHSKAPSLSLYAALELSVALWCLVMALGWDRLAALSAALLSLAGADPLKLHGLRLLVAAGWILPATIPMGASFPAVVDALDAYRFPRPGRAMAAFYALNLAGAIAGAVAAPYLLFPAFGIDGSLGLCAGLDALVSLAAFRLATGARRPEAAPAGARAAPLSLRSVPLLLVAFLCGFLFFSLEVLWTHLIGAVLGNSVFAFGTMLATVLLGLFAGSLLAALLLPASESVPAWLPGALLLLGGSLLASSAGLWPEIPMRVAEAGFGARSFGAAEWARAKQAIRMILPAASVLGMVYPLLFRIPLFPASERGTWAGRIGATNAVGCVLGALATAFLAIPSLGSERTLLALVAVSAASGAVLIVAYGPARRRRLGVAVAGALVALAALRPPWNRVALTSGAHVYFRRGHVRPFSHLLFFAEDAFSGITTVVENPDPPGPPTRVLLTNGKFQGSDAGETAAQTAFGLVPSLYTPGLHRALVIGLGTGQTAHALSELGFEEIEVAEIAPAIVEAARAFFGRVNGGVLGSPGTRVHLEDGRNLVARERGRFDLVTIEVSSIWFSGATNVYSVEFYRLLKGRLVPGGVVQQWIQLHHIGLAEVRCTIATLRAVFSDVSFWVVGGQGLIVAGDGPQEVGPVFLDAISRNGPRLGWPAEAAPDRLAELLACRLLSPEDVTRLAARPGIVLNTDRNRFLEYATPRYNHLIDDRFRKNVAGLAEDATFPPHRTAPGAAGALAERARSVSAEDARRALDLEAPAGAPARPRPPLTPSRAAAGRSAGARGSPPGRSPTGPRGRGRGGGPSGRSRDRA